MVYIYILKLDDNVGGNKYYIGKTNDPERRLGEHLTGNGAAWTKLYKPIERIELIPDCDEYDEDKYTFKYMAKYGIENVRGGNFCQVVLSKADLKYLNKMFNGFDDKCYICGIKGHFAAQCENKKEKVINPPKPHHLHQPHQPPQPRKVFNDKYDYQYEDKSLNDEWQAYVQNKRETKYIKPNVFTPTLPINIGYQPVVQKVLPVELPVNKPVTVTVTVPVLDKLEPTEKKAILEITPVTTQSKPKIKSLFADDDEDDEEIIMPIIPKNNLKNRNNITQLFNDYCEKWSKKTCEVCNNPLCYNSCYKMRNKLSHVCYYLNLADKRCNFCSKDCYGLCDEMQILLELKTRDEIANESKKQPIFKQVSEPIENDSKPVDNNSEPVEHNSESSQTKVSVKQLAQKFESSSNFKLHSPVRPPVKLTSTSSININNAPVQVGSQIINITPPPPPLPRPTPAQRPQSPPRPTPAQRPHQSTPNPLFPPVEYPRYQTHPHVMYTATREPMFINPQKRAPSPPPPVPKPPHVMYTVTRDIPPPVIDKKLSEKLSYEEHRLLMKQIHETDDLSRIPDVDNNTFDMGIFKKILDRNEYLC